MKHALAIAFICLGTVPAIAGGTEDPARVDPLLDCSTPILDADTPERASILRVQAGADALVKDLRQTYASRLAGLFWDQQEGAESRLVLRLTGDEPVEARALTVCGEPLTVEFIASQMHTREELRKLHSDNLEWLRGKFPGLQGTYADERTGEIVLEIYTPEAQGTDFEALRQGAESRLDAPLRIEMTTAKVGLAILNRAP
ncbi:hypothetical protein MIC97_20630 [Aquamicrobium sp. NLF2-7]|uniref:hypothetical protein n=1 Tax=Aquamicrobium sp. NLF2-7 TaxID=2918753 RepID=UPI001EFA6BE1|nr:hypothetical protein [Aquamicrobium sp. NLF2-7]MCG8273894.1 hypothetical protein [Aquamicrobium sp. NLF2-7]